MSTPTCSISKETFTAVFGEVLSDDTITARLAEFRQSPAGVAPRVPGHQLIKGLVFHCLLPCGHLAAHVQQLTGHRLSGSSISERRETMGCILFQALLKEALAPIAKPDTHPQAFYCLLYTSPSPRD